ncbi:hypothetical protein [Saccharopolyspora hattusasensis]|uniref:hypothetical protein n=1 Tax=Saccharopolyspora hattusasensis TaxID=1128679 RepID=UPI003D96BC42
MAPTADDVVGHARRLRAVYQSLTSRDTRFLDRALTVRVADDDTDEGLSRLTLRSEGGQFGSREWAVAVEFRLDRSPFWDYPVQRDDWRRLTRGFGAERVIVSTWSQADQRTYRYALERCTYTRDYDLWAQVFTRAAFEALLHMSLAQTLLD